MNMFLQFLIFASFGTIIDFLFTTIVDYFTYKKLKFEPFKKYVYMFFIYGVGITLFIPIFKWFLALGFNTLTRLSIYLIGLYFIEFLSGFLIKKITGKYVWYYSGKYQYKHLVNFAYAPAWLVFVYILELIAFRISL